MRRHEETLVHQQAWYIEYMHSNDDAKTPQHPQLVMYRALQHGLTFMSAALERHILADCKSSGQGMRPSLGEPYCLEHIPSSLPVLLAGRLLFIYTVRSS
jgi:hypothetical protein